MASDLIAVTLGYLAPQATLLLAAVALDLVLGDPIYALHPIRLMGATLRFTENLLRRIRVDGYSGGILLFVTLAMFWLGALLLGMLVLAQIWSWLAFAFHLFALYSMLALGDLLRHVFRVERALQKGDLALAKTAIAKLVGRDTEPMDEAACRRAAIESLSENLTDGFLSPLFWYALLGLPGIVLFKIISTMDSMVGNKTPRYLRFGWCGARLDDAMNFIPARLSLPLITVAAALTPRCSPRKSWRIGRAQHGLLPSPNSGWSEAATAGAIQRRLVGPIWMQGALVTEVWLGDASDPPAATQDDVVRSIALSLMAGLVAVALTAAALAALF